MYVRRARTVFPMTPPEAEALHEQKRAGGDCDPGRLVRQHSGPKEQQPCGDQKDAPEHVPDAVERERQEVQGVGDAFVVMCGVGCDLAAEQPVDPDVADPVEGGEQHTADEAPRSAGCRPVHSAGSAAAGQCVEKRVATSKELCDVGVRDLSVL